MKLVNNISISVFVYEGEDEDKIRSSLIGLFPFDLEAEKISVSRRTATGFNERKIRILEVLLEKDRHTRKFMDSLKSHFPEGQLNLLRTQAESRLDSDFNFFIRLHKPGLLKSGEHRITDSGDCFHIRMSIAAFPKKREVALDILKVWLR